MGKEVKENFKGVTIFCAGRRLLVNLFLPCRMAVVFELAMTVTSCAFGRHLSGPPWIQLEGVVVKGNV